MRAHASLRLGTLHGTTPELLASPWYCAWGFCIVWEAGLPHKTSSAPPQRRNGRACSSLTARGGGLPVGVIVGKSILSYAEDEEGKTPSLKRFGFVQTLDTKSKRRLYEVLRSQDIQMNQAITFLSDGNDSLRQLQLAVSPK